MATSIFEVVLTQEDEDGNDKLVFGPKAYTATNSDAAIVQATAEAIAGGVKIDGTVRVKTRFFG